MYSKGALAKKAADKFAHQESVRAALAFARFHERGAKWAISNGDFLDSVTVNVLQSALDGELKYCNGERRDDELLTEQETKRLITWVQRCAMNTNPCTDREISEKVVEMLRYRWASNKRKRHAKAAGCVPLTSAEQHFHGEFGVEAELIDMGIMDPETKGLRRVFWTDEMPQALDNNSAGPRPRAWGIDGERLQSS